jgi:hypothetical protein
VCLVISIGSSCNMYTLLLKCTLETYSYGSDVIFLGIFSTWQMVKDAMNKHQTIEKDNKYDYEYLIFKGTNDQEVELYERDNLVSLQNQAEEETTRQESKKSK